MRRLKDYHPVLSSILGKIAQETTFNCVPPLEAIVEKYPKLVVALSHSTPLSWLPSASLLGVKFFEAGGAERVPMGVMDSFFFDVPGIREIARYLTQSQRSLSYFELSERFETRGDFDLVLYPEGSNCFFGRPEEIQEFRSSKFVELALRTDAPILIGVHLGSENWAKTIEVPLDMMRRLNLLPNFVFDFVEKRIKKTGRFVLPLLPMPMRKFHLRCELFVPELKLSDLSKQYAERVLQLKLEGARIRLRMQEMLAELRQEVSASDEKSTGKTSVHKFGLDARGEMMSNLNTP